MLTAIGLRNFKRFGAKHVSHIPLGERVTLLLGPNSAGKSSVIQALLLLKQSWPDGHHVARLLAEGPEVHLGTAQNLVHLQKPGGRFEISVDQRFGGGRVRRLWVSARAREDGTADVERYGWSRGAESETSAVGPQRVNDLGGVVATQGDPREWAGRIVPMFELSSGSVPRGVSPELDSWLSLGSGPDDPSESYVLLSHPDHPIAA